MFNKIIKIVFLLSLSLILCSYKSDEDIKLFSPENGIHVVSINIKDSGLKLKPYISDELESVEEMAKKNDAIVAINAGFFDPKSKDTISYVIIDGLAKGNPSLNKALMNNKKIKPYLDQILNRTEFRIMENPLGEVQCEIAPHNKLPPDDYKIIHAVQAGPLLLPKLQEGEEAFVVKKDGKLIRHAADALKKRERSGVGIKKNQVFFVLVTEDAAMSLKDFSLFMKNELGLDNAMAFDGGTSSALYVKLPRKINGKVIRGNEAITRKVKSILLVN